VAMIKIMKCIVCQHRRVNFSCDQICLPAMVFQNLFLFLVKDKAKIVIEQYVILMFCYVFCVLRLIETVQTVHSMQMFRKFAQHAVRLIELWSILGGFL
jgi:hypothetical protein